MAVTAKKIIFSGRVQGVGFRYTALRIAGQYEITGYIKNLPNGSVEMFAQGQTREIQNCISHIEEHLGNYIRQKQVTESAYSPRYDSFNIAF